MAEKPWEKFKRKAPAPTGQAKPWEKFQQPAETKAAAPGIKMETPKGTGLTTQPFTPGEISAIARKHNVTPEFVENWINLSAGETEHQARPGFSLERVVEDAPAAGKVMLGTINNALGNIPASLINAVTKDENEKKAIDDIRELAQKKMSLLGYGATIGGSALLPIGAAAKAGVAKQAAVGAATGAAFGAGEARTGEALEGATTGALLGGALGGIAAKLTKGVKSPKAKEDIEAEIARLPNIDEAIDEEIKKRARQLDIERKAIAGEPMTFSDMKRYLGPEIIRKVPSTSDLRAMANTKIDSRIKQFENFTGKTVEEMDREGVEFMGRQYERFLRDNVADVVIGNTLLKGSVRKSLESKYLPRQLKELSFKFSDNIPLAKTMDARLGTNIEQTLNSLSKNHINYNILLGKNVRELARLRKQARKEKVSEAAIYKALDTGERGKLSKELVGEWKEFFETNRQLANELGLPIPKRENYVPHRRLPPIKYTVAVKNKAQELSNKFGVNLLRVNRQKLNALKKKKEFKPLFAEVEFVHGGRITKPEQFQETLWKMMNTPEHSYTKLAVDTFATKAREGSIPDFVRDKRAGSLGARWLQATLRSALLRDGIEDLKLASKIAEKAGDDFTAKHLRDLTSDIVGSRPDTFYRTYLAPVVDKFQIMSEEKAQAAKTRFSKAIYEGMADSPELFSQLMMQVYPNYLGLNPKSALQNVFSPAMFTVPDLGYGYGSTTAMKAYTDAMALLSKVGHPHKIKLSTTMARKLGKEPGEAIYTKDINLITQNYGMLPPQWTGELVAALQDGIRASVGRDMARSALDKYTRGMMFLFEKSENLARTTSYFMGRRIGKDLTSDPVFAKKFLSNIDSPSYQRALLKAIKSEDTQAAQKLMVDYINSNNMFNYDRITMSAYGRYLGPMFSVFSKWPTHISGRVMSQLEREGAWKGGMKVARTLLMPYFAFLTLDAIYSDEDSDLQKKLVGSKGLAGWTPIDSTFSVVQDGIGKPPAIEAATSIRDAIFDERKDLNRAMQKVGGTFMPTAGFWRFLGEDIPIYRGQSKPTGPVLERRLESILKQMEGK